MATKATSTNKAGLMTRMNSMKIKALLVMGTLVGLTGTVSAAIDWANITAILTGMTSQFLPALVDFIVAMVPILVVLAIIGFILGFLDKILAMINFK